MQEIAALKTKKLIFALLLAAPFIVGISSSDIQNTEHIHNPIIEITPPVITQIIVQSLIGIFIAYVFVIGLSRLIQKETFRPNIAKITITLLFLISPIYQYIDALINTSWNYALTHPIKIGDHLFFFYIDVIWRGFLIYLLLSIVTTLRNIRKLAIALASVSLFILISTPFATSYTGWEGTSTQLGLPIPFVSPDGAGGSTFSLVTLMADLIFWYAVVYLTHRFIARRKLRTKL